MTVTPEGAHVVQYRASDNAGNTEAPKSVNVKIDATPPTTTAQLDPRQPGASGWYDDAVQLTLRVNDGTGSGGGTTEYRIGSGDWQTYNSPVTLSEVGTYSITYRTTDAAGNVEAAGAPVVAKVDGRAPTTSAVLDPAQPGAGGTYRGPVSVSLVADDGAGRESTDGDPVPGRRRGVPALRRSVHALRARRAPGRVPLHRPRRGSRTRRS